MPNPANETPLSNPLSRPPVLPLLPVSVNMLLFAFLHRKIEEIAAKNPSQAAGAIAGQLSL